MGKKANERRKRIFEEVNGKSATKPRRPSRPKEVIDLCYCRRTYGELPNGFKMCIDCPAPEQIEPIDIGHPTC